MPYRLYIYIIEFYRSHPHQFGYHDNVAVCVHRTSYQAGRKTHRQIGLHLPELILSSAKLVIILAYVETMATHYNLVKVRYQSALPILHNLTKSPHSGGADPNKTEGSFELLDRLLTI